MRLPPFVLHRPTSFEEADATLAEYGDEAAVYCGGTELFLVMKLGLASYPQLVDLKRIAELHVLAERDGYLSVGAAVTHRELESSPLVQKLLPTLARPEKFPGLVLIHSHSSVTLWRSWANKQKREPCLKNCSNYQRCDFLVATSFGGESDDFDG